jgi:hypothetical protein
VVADFDAHGLHVIGRDELLANKRASGRDKDNADVKALESHLSPRPRPRKGKPRNRK